MRSERHYEVLGFIVLIVTILLCVALVGDGFQQMDLESRPVDGMAAVPNWLGAPGAMVAGALSIIVGDAAHTLYGLALIWGMMMLANRPFDRPLSRIIGLFVLTGAVAGLLQLNIDTGVSNPQPGGLFGAFLVERLLQPNFAFIGSNVVGATLVVIGILLSTDFLAIHAVLLLKRGAVSLIHGNLAFYEGTRVLLNRSRQLAVSRASRREDPSAVYELEDDEEIYAAEEEGPGLISRMLEKLRPAPWEEDDAEDEVEEKPAAPAARTRKAPARAARARDALDSDGPRITLSKRAQKDDEEDRADDVLPPIPEPEELDLPFDSLPDDEDFLEEDEVQPLYEDPDPAVIAAQAAAAAAVPAPTKKRQLDLIPNTPAREPKIVRKAKRKTPAYEEIPADYQYPKRYTKPPIDMFDESFEREIPNLKEKLKATSISLEECLQTFGVEARVTDVTRGPTITRFEIEPAPGVKVSRFQALADDIALALKAHRVRVEAPIPGKGRVGIEVPNHERDSVLLRELLESRPFAKGKGALKLALGKDIAGEVKIADLATMPHLLVAGATGAGKTVCVKALLASLLFQHTPDELQLILIDPKMVELSIFNDIPHLITPVVTDPKKASVSLQWLISEMEERYRLFAELRVRNIEVYNESVDNGEIEVEGAEEGEGESYDLVRKLPYIVCIIDELADLMMLARAEVEDCIARLAQLARAVGIHLIIATQRPSVDVLTGVIKANFPARLSFQVSSRVDSRCILDEIGAERLIGNGDLLYLPAGQSKPLRIQGAFVSDDEMNSLVHYLKKQAPPQYRDEIENFGKGKDKTNEILDEDDPLLDEAVQVVLETGQASISMVQRRLRVGYTRAARLIDMMELRGIVGPHTGSKAREILVNTVSARDDE